MLDFLFGYFHGTSLALWGPFIVLVCCGLGLPIPEDIVLVTAGLLCEDAGHSWIQTSIVMWVGVMAGDSLIFLLGRHFGMRVLASRWGTRIFSPARQAKTKALFERYGSMVLFVARFLPGVRAPTFCSAGAMHVPYAKFLLFDGGAALLSVPVFVALGHWLWAKFGTDLGELADALARTRSYSLWAGIALAVVVVVLTIVWQRRARANAAPAKTP